VLTGKEIDYLNRLENECDFFCGKGKHERERWVVEKFLTGLNINFENSQIHQGPPQGIIDIKYESPDGTAYFEIKDVTNMLQNTTIDGKIEIEPERISGTYKKLREVIKKCRSEEVLHREEIYKALNHSYLDKESQMRAFDVNNEKGIDVVLQVVEKYTAYYNDRSVSINEIDLLIHCIRSRVGEITQNEIKDANLKTFGWRSISFLGGKGSRVLYASTSAPKYFVTSV
jgi:hypothetical protein